ncbi:MAG: S8 family serine peptidase, partial [Cyclobacteriaceae bacterium]|nr:S8 family serine peptidase [Cyclobacteriaceae bacterium]
MRKYFLIFLAAISFYSGFSQQTIEETIPQNWMNQDSESDSLYGVSTEKAYKFLKKKKSVPIIVGVLDSGVDIDHEDLKGKIWTNPNEIAGNGKDDDGNGYIDDVHGWNF